jgi:long-subunit acyl-CoA synthetase (AMP-forming)
MAHVAERYISHYQSMTFGYTITSCPDPRQLAAALVEVRPTRLFSVPRTFEKLAAAATQAAADRPGAHAALESRIARHIADPEAPVDFHAELESASELAGVREQLGLDQVEWLTAGGAPTRRDVLDLFAALGLPVVELWGMSETLLALSNPPGAIRIGTVGMAQPGFEAALARDGELLVRGPMFTRYRKDPVRTAEALAGGWMHSGDIATVDEDGYHRIVDRKKEIIINSAGKNMAPALIESAVRQQSPVIAHAVAIGDARAYVTALVVLDPDGVAEFAAQRGLHGSFEDLAGSAAIQEEVTRGVEAANASLARVEQVKRFRIVDTPWLPGGDELTPTSKLKRRVIAEKYAGDIEALYPG